MKWIKYKNTYGQANWKYLPLHDIDMKYIHDQMTKNNTDIGEEFMEYMEDIYGHGYWERIGMLTVDVQEVCIPPIEVLQRQINEQKNKIKLNKEHLKDLQEILREVIAEENKE